MDASVIHAPVRPRRAAPGGRPLRVRTDDQLVALFRLGYDDAFDAIHDRYQQRLLIYVRRMLARSGLDAEDVLQDTFVRAYLALREDERPVTLRAWLYRVAHNRCIDHLRRPELPLADVLARQRPPLDEPSAVAERREDLRLLVVDVRGLPAQQRSALLMRELEGLSYAEVADALDTTLPAVKSLLVRARTGITEAGAARNADCADIRADLEHARARGVRAGARSRRHLRECAGCRAHRAALRRDLHAAVPGGPLAALAKLLGLGGAGSAAGGGAGAAAGTGVAATATAGKLVAAVCAVAVVGGGAAEVQQQHVARPAYAAPVRATVAPARLGARPVALVPAAVVRRHARSTRGPAAARPAVPASAGVAAPAARPATTPADLAPDDVTRASGGVRAPDEDPPATPEPAPAATTADPPPPTADVTPAPGPASPAATTEPATATVAAAG